MEILVIYTAATFTLAATWAVTYAVRILRGNG